MNPYENYEVKEQYSKGFIKESKYIEMRDGNLIAITMYFPKDKKPADKFYPIISLTRYWREMELKKPLSWFLTADHLNKINRNYKKYLTSQGYVLVYIDERGTGASFGEWKYPWFPQTVEDMYDIVEWLISQPWAEQAVGAIGSSYVGTTSELLATCGHSAVKAVIPKFNHPDPYTHIALPGGLYNQHFMKDWSDTDDAFDIGKIPDFYPWVIKTLIRGIKPVDADKDENQLNLAINDHKNNTNTYSFTKTKTFRDELDPDLKISIDDIGLGPYLNQLKNNDIKIAGWASWMDAGTADAAIRRWLTFPNASHVYIGAWEHGGLRNASPYLSPKSPVNPHQSIQWQEYIRFFDSHLKNKPTGMKDEKYIYYYVMGTGKWRKDTTFPPASCKPLQYYLYTNSELNLEQPTIKNEFRTYTIDWEATTGKTNRWWELHSLYQGTVIYNDRRKAAAHLLTYDSPPLTSDIEIIGYPVITLNLTSTHSDGNIIVYLEDVFPDGQVVYITEGMLRVIHRSIASPEKSPYFVPVGVPYHTFRKEDGKPLNPGEITKIKFALQPTAVRIKKNHRIRVSIAGHDKDTFIRVPKQDTPTLKIYDNSYITLPHIKN